jgi:hypothetical protein
MAKKTLTTADQLAAKLQQAEGVRTRLAEAQRTLVATNDAAVAAAISGDASDALRKNGEAAGMVRLLEAGLAKLEAEIAGLQADVAREESLAIRRAAKPVLHALADELAAVEGEILPLLAKYSKMVVAGDAIVEVPFKYQVMPALSGMDGAAKVMQQLAGQLRGAADAIEHDDPHDVYLAVAKRALATTKRAD